ncbi:succinate-semialdehyde dehydrogenase [Alternaria alternata]|nr:succinate-semialdehyde dehydrogenase [Alternaria alternata]
MDLESLARLCIYPFSVDICLALQERLVIELCKLSAPTQSTMLAQLRAKHTGGTE